MYNHQLHLQTVRTHLVKIVGNTASFRRNFDDTFSCPLQFELSIVAFQRFTFTEFVRTKMVEFQCPHCDLIFPDIGSVKIHIHNAHKDVRHKYAEVNKNDAANNFNLLSTSTDIPQPDRTTASFHS